MSFSVDHAEYPFSTLRHKLELPAVLVSSVHIPNGSSFHCTRPYFDDDLHSDATRSLRRGGNPYCIIERPALIRSASNTFLHFAGNSSRFNSSGSCELILQNEILTQSSAVMGNGGLCGSLAEGKEGRSTLPLPEMGMRTAWKAKPMGCPTLNKTSQHPPHSLRPLVRLNLIERSRGVF